MGNECTTCNCNLFQGEDSEMVIAERPLADIKNQGEPLSKQREATSSPIFDLARYIKTPNLKKIIKIQSRWRGHHIRKEIEYLRSNQGICSKYFLPSEGSETLTKKVFDFTAPLQKREPYQYKSGAVYTGEWRGGFREGHGEMRWVDGASYVGEWKLGSAHGKGLFFHADGDSYEGDWAYNRALGFGKYSHRNGATYEGFWKDDVQHGEGREIWEDGAIYEGEYSFGKKNGNGTYKWNDGAIYSGSWEENIISGVGFYQWPDGRCYAGHWNNSNMNGFGIYLWPGERRYIGFFANDQKEGYGMYFWPDGRIFSGWWRENRQHGLGVYTVPGESERHGLWENGRRVSWFTPKQIQLISNGTQDYRELFSSPDSAISSPVESNFFPPSQYHTEYSQLKLFYPDFF